MIPSAWRSRAFSPVPAAFKIHPARFAVVSIAIVFLFSGADKLDAQTASSKSAMTFNASVNLVGKEGHKIMVHSARFDLSPPLTSMHYVRTAYKPPAHHIAPAAKPTQETQASSTVSTAGAAVELRPRVPDQR
ncbi:MAG: hypothetical protein WA708_13290 [Acidobacteriaceae bacterium]